MTSHIGARPGRNEPCHCGSGKKYKQCCLEKDAAEATAARTAAAADAPAPAPEAASGAPKRKSTPRTEQPWKATTRGFVPRSSIPRKVGGG